MVCTIPYPNEFFDEISLAETRAVEPQSPRHIKAVSRTRDVTICLRGRAPLGALELRKTYFTRSIKEDPLSIFDRIKHAIFGEAHAAPAPQAAIPSPSSNTSSPAARTSTSPASSSPTPSTTPAAPTASSSAAQPTKPAPSQTGRAASGSASAASLDVETILNDAVKKSGQKLDWRHSIVDLMKALGMDASLEERKELAQELGYSSDTHDTAKMNTFLHKALMKKLSENGGKVPADLLD